MGRIATLWMLGVLALGCGSPAATSSGVVDAASDNQVTFADLGAAGADVAAADLADTKDDAVADADKSSADVAADALEPIDALGDTAATDTDPGDASAADIAADLPQTEEIAVAPPPLFDLAQIGDAASAKCTFSNQHTVVKDGVVLTAWDLSYQSWESIDGVLKPIQIKAFAARPGSAQILPGVVQAHGLGGYAQESHATGTAALLGMFVIAFTGPGGGTDATNTSEGEPSGFNKGYRMFDVIKDIRGTWFWGHATAAMRAVTCLATRPDIDQSHLGMTGFSAGGVVTLLAAGHDPRLGAAVPLSGTLAWASAVEAPKAWQHVLLQKAGLSVTSPEWLKLQAELIDPVPALQACQAKVFMINGSSDEFFPLTAHNATYAAIPSNDKRTAIVGNFDHGCYEAGLAESKQTVADRASLYATGGQRAWFRHWFGTDANYAYMPAPPVVTVTVQGGLSLVAAQVDTGGSKLGIDEVRVWGSNSSDLIWASNKLDCKGGVCSKLVPLPLDATTSWYVDVIYKTGGLLPEKFAVSSLPVLAQNLVPDMLCGP